MSSSSSSHSSCAEASAALRTRLFCTARLSPLAYSVARAIVAVPSWSQAHAQLHDASDAATRTWRTQLYMAAWGAPGAGNNNNNNDNDSATSTTGAACMHIARRCGLLPCDDNSGGDDDDISDYTTPLPDFIAYAHGASALTARQAQLRRCDAALQCRVLDSVLAHVTLHR